MDTLAGLSCCSDFLKIIAVDPEKYFTILPWLPDHTGITLHKDGIIVGSRIDGDVHSPIIFNGHTYPICGRIEPTGMRCFDEAVFIQIEDALVMADESGTKSVKPLVLPPGIVSSVLVQLDPGASPASCWKYQSMRGTRHPDTYPGPPLGEGNNAICRHHPAPPCEHGHCNSDFYSGPYLCLSHAGQGDKTGTRDPGSIGCYIGICLQADPCREIFRSAYRVSC